jgi:hypothetical protein
MANNINFKNKYTILTIFVVVLAVFAIYFFAKEVQKRQSLNSKAGVDTVQLFFQIGEIVLPPQTDVYVLASTNKSVGFARVVMEFDKSKVNLSSEVNVSESSFKKIIKVTSKDEANSSGIVEIVLGVDPSDTQTIPSGNIQIGKFTLSSVTNSENVITSMNFSQSSSQIVDMDAQIFSLTTNNLSIKINPLLVTATPLSTQIPNEPNVVVSSPTPMLVTATPLSTQIPNEPNVVVSSPTPTFGAVISSAKSISSSVSTSIGTSKSQPTPTPFPVPVTGNTWTTSLGFTIGFLTIVYSLLLAL